MELYIENNHGSSTTTLWVYDPGLNFDLFYGYDNGELVRYQVGKHEKPSQEMKPFLSLPTLFANDFIRLLTELANKKRIHTENESKREGRLAATQLHLADLQMITKKLLKINP